MKADEKANIEVDGEGQEWFNVAAISARRRRDGIQNKSECLRTDQYRECIKNH